MNPKSKAIIMNKFNDMIPLLLEKPVLLQKHIIPSACKCAEDNKTDVKFANQKLLRTIHNHMGRAMIDAVPSNKA